MLSNHENQLHLRVKFSVYISKSVFTYLNFSCESGLNFLRIFFSFFNIVGLLLSGPEKSLHRIFL